MIFNFHKSLGKKHLNLSTILETTSHWSTIMETTSHWSTILETPSHWSTIFMETPSHWSTILETPSHWKPLQILWRTPDFQQGPQVIHRRPQDFRWRLSSDFHWRPQDFCWRPPYENLGVSNKILGCVRGKSGGLQRKPWGLQ